MIIVKHLSLKPLFVLTVDLKPCPLAGLEDLAKRYLIRLCVHRRIAAPRSGLSAQRNFLGFFGSSKNRISLCTFCFWDST